MARFNDLFTLRSKNKEQQNSSSTALTQMSSNFSGLFPVTPLNEMEKDTLTNILRSYRQDELQDWEKDLSSLITLTSEVKAITNQAVILHGERIKKAQEILKNYQDGAFTTWLITTYGNRQTPYNFLQYYEFYVSMPKDLHPKIDKMPRQAVYTLASRGGDAEKKAEIIQNYAGEPKHELLSIIRNTFPLEITDKRLPNFSSQFLSFLKRASSHMEHPLFSLNEKQRTDVEKLLEKLKTALEK